MRNSLCRRRIAIVGFLVASVNLLLPFSVSAVSPTAELILSPARHELIMAPGESKQVFVRISNRSSSPRDFVVYWNSARDIVSIGTSEAMIADSLLPYVFLGIESGTIAPGADQEIPITITLPDSVALGGLQGIMVVSFLSDEPANQSAGKANSALRAGSALGSMFLVRVDGLARENGGLSDFRSVAGRLVARPPVFSMTFNNRGNVYLNPYGGIIIRNLLTGSTSSVTIDPFFVLPKTSRQREFTWLGSSGLGLYNSTLFLNRGYGNIIDQNSFLFMVIPRTFVSPATPLFALLAIILLIFVMLQWRRWQRRKKV